MLIEHDIKLLQHQLDLLTSKSKHTWLKAGLGSGKSYALGLWLIKQALEQPQTMGLISANTYKQLTGSILTAVMNHLDTFKIPFKFNKLEQMLYIYNGAKLACFSLENYEQLRGIEFGYAAVDEAAFARPEAIDVLAGRIRCPKADRLHPIRYASTPNGFNFLYEAFAGDKKSKYHELINGRPKSNPAISIEYYDSLKAMYDPLTYRQEVLGEFVVAQAGLVHPYYNPLIHNKTKPTMGKIYAACDFNVDPLTAVVFSVDEGSKTMHVFDEVYLHHADTYMLAQELHQKQLPIEGVIPDATGSRRQTQSLKSDHQILREAGFEVLTRSRNPAQRDRINAVNRMFRENRITIDGKQCSKLTKDLKELRSDNSDPMLGHISDALGYGVWWFNPLKKVNPEPETIKL